MCQVIPDTKYLSHGAVFTRMIKLHEVSSRVFLDDLGEELRQESEQTPNDDGDDDDASIFGEDLDVGSFGMTAFFSLGFRLGRCQAAEKERQKRENDPLR